MKIPNSNLKASLFPAGVPLGLVRLKRRMGAFFEGAPLFFIGVVLAVAVLFRVAVHAIRPMEAEAGPEATTSAPHVLPALERPATAATPTTALATAPSPESPGIDPTRVAPSATGRGLGQAPPAPPRRRPRTHGRR